MLSPSLPCTVTAWLLMSKLPCMCKHGLIVHDGNARVLNEIAVYYTEAHVSLLESTDLSGREARHISTPDTETHEQGRAYQPNDMMAAPAPAMGPTQVWKSSMWCSPKIVTCSGSTGYQTRQHEGSRDVGIHGRCSSWHLASLAQNRA